MVPEHRFTLAEDDDDFLYLVHRQLSHAFPRSSFASFSNAEEALAHVLDVGTDLIVTNHGMGQMSGTEMIRELRRRGFKLPIIMVSGSSEAKAEAMEAGANLFVHKDEAVKGMASHVRSLLP